MLTSLKSFQLPKFEEITEENLDDSKYRLSLFYCCFKNPDENTALYTPENVISKMRVEFQEKNHEKFIENMLETTLENFGKDFSIFYLMR